MSVYPGSSRPFFCAHRPAASEKSLNQLAWIPISSFSHSRLDARSCHGRNHASSSSSGTVPARGVQDLFRMWMTRRRRRRPVYASRRVRKMVAYIAQVSSVMVEGVVALATWRRSREVMMERCEGTISLGSLQSFTEDAMRKSFVP